MSNTLICSIAAAACAVRAAAVIRLWSAPRKNGDAWFLSRRVPPGFYAAAGAALLRRYRTALLAWLVVDAPLVLWLVATRQFQALAGEQFVALVLAAIANNLTLAHFSLRAARLAPPSDGPAPSAVQLSLSPRRLRHHTTPLVELAIAAALIASLALVARAHAVASEPWVTWNVSRWLRSADSVTAWVLYLQFGLLLLKLVFVRWRMPLPLKRTDDFRRWRAAWLEYYLRLFDALRILLALALLSAVVWITQAPAAPAAFAAGWLLILAEFIVFAARQNRCLNAVAAETKPIELVSEFPRQPIPEGRFVAGLLYVNPGNPGVLVPSNRGLAVNIANPTTYAWTAYLLGLAILTTWVTR